MFLQKTQQEKKRQKPRELNLRVVSKIQFRKNPDNLALEGSVK